MKPLIGTIRGKTIELSDPSGLRDGDVVEILIVARTSPPAPNAAEAAPPAWWTEEDDRILADLERLRRLPAPRELPE